MSRRFGRAVRLMPVASVTAALVLATQVHAHANARAPRDGGSMRLTQGGQPGQAGQDCQLAFQGVVVNGHPTNVNTSPSPVPGKSITFVGGGVNARCTNTDQHLLSDSAEQHDDQRLLYLVGHVHYTEKRVELTADRITYYMGEERLVAEGNVEGRTSTGTHFRGPRAVYLRARAGLRDRSRLDAGGRPDTWISGKDAGTNTDTPDSTHVLADSIISDNDSLVYATGKVEIVRTDIAATSDSAMLDQGREIAALRRTPHVAGRGTRKFTLDGLAIDIFSRNRQAERVRSAGSAVATSEDVRLVADTIDLRIADRQISRAVAWGKGVARATQLGRDITADSIDVNMPQQKVQSLHAVRHAKVASLPDSLKVRSRERDWFAGDTIIADFDTTATRDTSSASIKHLVALGAAQSFQQSARDGAALPDSAPALNYMAAKTIAVDFNPDHSLNKLRVTGQVSGVMVQPAADTTKRGAAPAIKRPVPPSTPHP